MVVCRRNPDSIIKWERAPVSAPVSAASSRGSVQMLAAAPTQSWMQSHQPQHYYPAPGGIPPPGYFWPPPPAAQFPFVAPSAPPVAAAPLYQGVGASAAPASVAYAMPTADSVGRPDVVTGTLLVDSVEALVLFYSRATFSFASLDFVNRAQLSMQSIAQSVLVNSPGGILSSSTVCPGCVISLDDEEFIANLMVLRMESFDVILGMDWLHTQLCSANKV